MISFTLAELAETLGARLIGRGDIRVERIVHPADVTGPLDLAFATDEALLPLLEKTKAHAVVVTESGAEKLPPRRGMTRLEVTRPRLALATLTTLFAKSSGPAPGIHPTAVVEPSAVLGDNVTLGAFVYVGPNAHIGAGAVLHPHVFVGEGATIGAGTVLRAGVCVGEGVQLGARCLVHFNASLGADGFSFVTPEAGSVESAKSTGAVGATNTALVRIASLGPVIIGDDVEIGANTSLDRGTLRATRIGNGTKIDNQVQVGHNVVVGENVLLCGRVGIAGSAVIGDRVVLGGGVGVADHVTVGADSVVMGMSGVAGNVLPKSVVGGLPAKPRSQLLEDLLQIGRLKSLARRVATLTTRLDALEKTPSPQKPS